MEKYLVWFEDGKTVKVDTIEEVIALEEKKPITVTCEIYIADDIYIGEYDMTFEDFVKQYFLDE